MYCLAELSDSEAAGMASRLNMAVSNPTIRMLMSNMTSRSDRFIVPARANLVSFWPRKMRTKGAHRAGG